MITHICLTKPECRNYAIYMCLLTTTSSVTVTTLGFPGANIMWDIYKIDESILTETLVI